MKKRKIHLWRRIVQIIIAALFIMLPLLNEAGFTFIWGNFLNMHVGSLTFSDPLAVLQVTLKNRYLPPGLLIGASLTLAIAFFLGTIFCSWICPFGLLSEPLHTLSCRIRAKHIWLQKIWPKKFQNNKILKNGFAIKAAVFCIAFLAFWIFARTPVLNMVSLPFQYSNIFQYLFLQKYLPLTIWILGGILLAEFVFSTRFWCRWICPQSVLISVVKLFNPFGLKIIFEKKSCVGAKAPFPCQKACSLDLDPRRLKVWSQVQCTNCGDCVDACTKTGKALGFCFDPK